MSAVYMSIDGVSSSEVGVLVKSHRTITPEITDSTMEVSGMDGFYDFKNNPSKSRLEEVDFFIKSKNLPDLRENIRLVSAWLRRSGKIIFSDEPDKYYMGRTYSAPRLEQNSSPSGRFSAVFKCQPFAYGAARADEATGVGEVSVPIDYPGTVPGCCLIIIRNTGTTPVSNIQLTHIYRR